MTGGALAPEGYRAFPNIERRNLFQQYLEIPVMCRALGLGRGMRILEVGCGRGIALEPFTRLLQPSRLVGIDIDGDVIAEARARAASAGLEVELRTADVRRLPFADASFDLVVDFGTCYHIKLPQFALGEICRVLVPGGLLVHETRASQLLSHPIRSLRRRVPWSAVPTLRLARHALLWATRRKRSGSFAWT
jgi:ubiquinone/menaquinone biosynthesis C-methylase UbiE